MMTVIQENELANGMHPKIRNMYDAIRKIEVAWVSKNPDHIDLAVQVAKDARLAYRDFLDDVERERR